MGIETLNEDLELNIPMFDDDMDIIAKLDDEPNAVGGLTAAELKAEFDRPGKTIQKYLNETLVPSLIGTVAEESVRAQNEYIRVTNENQRIINEEARERAEQAREDKTSGIVAQATEQANKAAAHAQDALAYAVEAGALAREASDYMAETVWCVYESGIHRDEAAASASSAKNDADRAETVTAEFNQVRHMSVEAETLPAGSNATVEKEETDAGDLLLRFGIPAGGGGGVSKASELDNDVPFVSADEQTLTDDQKAQARENIGVENVLESVGGDTLSWDGNTEGAELVSGIWYKASGVVPTKEDFASGCTVTFIGSNLPAGSGDSLTLQNSAEEVLFSNDGMGLVPKGSVFIIPSDNYEFEEDGDIAVFPAKGVYFPAQGWVTTLTIPGYTGFAKKKKIKEEYIPESVPNIQTAAVGQTIVVSEVDADGKPTKWEAKDAGAGGVDSYGDLNGKPSINGVELTGNKTSADLGIGNPTDEQVSESVESYLDAHPEIASAFGGLLYEHKVKNETLNIADIAEAVFDGISVTATGVSTTSGYKTYSVPVDMIKENGWAFINLTGNYKILGTSLDPRESTSFRAAADTSGIIAAGEIEDTYKYIYFNGRNTVTTVDVMKYTKPDRLRPFDYGVVGFTEKIYEKPVFRSKMDTTTTIGAFLTWELPAGTYAFVWNPDVIATARIITIAGNTVLLQTLPAFGSYVTANGFMMGIHIFDEPVQVQIGNKTASNMLRDNLDECCAILKMDKDAVGKIRDILPQKKRYILHRGDRKNKLLQGLLLGVSGCEFDVKTTSDGVYVLNHDKTINGLTIANSTYEALLAADPTICTLEEIIALCAKFRAWVYPQFDTQEEFVYIKRIVNRYGLSDRVVYCLGAVRKLDSTCLFAEYVVPNVADWTEDEKGRCMVFLNSTNFSSVPDGLRCESWSTTAVDTVLADDRISGICTDNIWGVYKYQQAENTL